MGEKNSKFKEALKLFETGMYPEAYTSLEMLSQKGDSDAQVLLGWMHQTGIGCAEDEEKALEWYNVAAAQGDINAEYAIGNFYKEKQAYPEAFARYKTAADNGHLPSLYNLALMYEFGRGVGIDADRAYGIYEDAASGGHLFSRMKVAKRHIKSGKLIQKLRGYLQYPGIAISIVWLVYRNRYDERICE